MSKYQNRIYRAVFPLLTLAFFLYLGFYRSLIFLLSAIFPALTLVFRSPEKRIAFNGVVLSALLPFAVAESIYALLLTPLILLSIDADLRKIEIADASFPGLTVFVLILSIQLLVYKILPETVYTIYLTAAYALLALLYEIFKISRMTVDKPKVVYCSAGELIDFEVRIDKA